MARLAGALAGAHFEVLAEDRIESKRSVFGLRRRNLVVRDHGMRYLRENCESQVGAPDRIRTCIAEFRDPSLTSRPREQ